MTWITPWTIFLICPVLALIGLWAAAPHVPGLRVLRQRFDAWAASCVDAIRRDPPPIYFLVRNVIEEMVDEWGPQLASGTNRNAIAGGIITQIAVAVPFLNISWLTAAVHGFCIIAALWYALRVLAHRKRGSTPIETPRDLGYRSWRHHQEGDAVAREFYEPHVQMERQAEAAEDTQSLSISPVVNAGCEVRLGVDPLETPAYLNDPPASVRKPKKRKPARPTRAAPKRAAKKAAKKTAKKRA